MTDNVDPAGARRDRDEAIKRGLENAKAAWKRAALEALVEVCLERLLFTSDHVMAKVVKTNTYTPDLRAMGGIITSAQRGGWIIKAPMPAQPSERRSLHASPRTVWKSLLWGAK